MSLLFPKKSVLKSFLIITGSLFLSVGCEKKENQPMIPEYGILTDVDSNEYKTVKIGNQWWMAENLKVTRYRNGQNIAMLKDSIDWVTSSNGAFCEYENGNSSSEPPGYLYNWSAVNNPLMLAPEGWHIPTDEEWKELEMALGMTREEADKLTWRGSDQGDQLKTSDRDEWAAYENIFSTNVSGFTALGGSCRLFNSYWGDPGLKNTGFWWSASGYAEKEAWYRYLDYKNANVFRSHTSQGYGFSVRCVKD